VLHRLAAGVLRIAEDTPGLVMAQTSSALTQPEYQLTVERRRAQELGLNVRMVAQQARHALNGGFTSATTTAPTCGKTRFWCAMKRAIAAPSIIWQALTLRLRWDSKCP